MWAFIAEALIQFTFIHYLLNQLRHHGLWTNLNNKNKMQGNRGTQWKATFCPKIHTTGYLSLKESNPWLAVVGLNGFSIVIKKCWLYQKAYYSLLLRLMCILIWQGMKRNTNFSLFLLNSWKCSMELDCNSEKMGFEEIKKFYVWIMCFILKKKVCVVIGCED